MEGYSKIASKWNNDFGGAEAAYSAGASSSPPSAASPPSPPSSLVAHKKGEKGVTSKQAKRMNKRPV